MNAEIKGRAKAALVSISIITAVSFAVYFNTLFNGFVYDDAHQILKNPWIRDFRHIPDFFIKNVWGFEGAGLSSYYRPVMHLIYMLTYHLFGLDAWGFHLVNVLLNAGVSILVFLITWRLLDEYRPQPASSNFLPALLAALLFTTHPVHTEAVAWAASVPELSFSLFYLLSLYFYIRSREGVKWGYALSAASFFIATLCKETALTLPLVLLAYDYAFEKNAGGVAGALKRLAPYIAITGGYLGLRLNALSGFLPLSQHPELSAYQNVINIFPLFAQQLEAIILPVNLNFFHVFHPINSVWGLKGIVAVVIAAGFIALLYLACKKDRMAFFGLSVIAAALLPALYIHGLGENVFAERYLYLPSFGFVLMASLVMARTDGVRMHAALTAAFLILAGLYSAGTVSRNAVWHDNYSLWADTVQKSPDAALAHENLGNAYLKKMLIDDAIEELETAITLNPRRFPAHNNLGYAYFLKGYLDMAVREYQTAVNLDPRFPNAHNSLGYIYFLKGWTDKALEEYKLALEIQPDSAETYNNLGMLYKKIGQFDKAIECFQTALRLGPARAGLYYNLAGAYEAEGRHDMAEEYSRKAMELEEGR